MSLPTYPEYKDSGVEWLGAIPSNWTTDRLKRRCHVFPSNVDKKSVDGERAVRLCNYTDVYYNDRIVPDMSLMDATATDQQIAKFTLRAGDTVFTKDSESADDIGVAAYVPSDLPGIVCGYHLSIARPIVGTNGAYVKWLFDARYTKARFAVLANGLTRVGLNQYAVDNMELPWPPFEEQVAIASFLDRETAKIDALIAEQEKLLALLAEKRQATISHAVTRGLDPKAPMKDSGIPWLGEVPAHWEVSPLKYISRIGNGSTPNRDNPDYWSDTGFPWLNSSVVNQDEVTEAERFVTEFALKECHLPVIRPPAVLVGITGQGKTRGMAAPLMFEATISQHLAYVAPKAGRLEVAYLLRALEIAYGTLRTDSESAGSTKGAITCDQLSRFTIPLPPLDEQGAIAKHIDIKAAHFEKLASDSRQAIALLKERRSALIAAAVTGHIDVRRALES